MFESMPVVMSIMEGMEIQAFTKKPMPRAHHLALSTLARKKTASCPEAVSSWFIGPLWENMNLKPSMLMKPGMA